MPKSVFQQICNQYLDQTRIAFQLRFKQGSLDKDALVLSHMLTRRNHPFDHVAEVDTFPTLNALLTGSQRK